MFETEQIFKNKNNEREKGREIRLRMYMDNLAS